jgi:GntR family transcriptional regulator, transcriptional repressor for pyruvate dehydrogenase complex
MMVVGPVRPVWPLVGPVWGSSVGKGGKRSDIIAEEIAEYVRRERLETGDRLPSERKLSDKLGVCRCSLREALRLLEAQGLVRVETGIGCFVAEQDDPLGIGADVVSHADTIELVELQATVAARAASLAAQRGTLDQRAALKSLADSLGPNATHRQVLDVAERMDALIGAASGNPLIDLLDDRLVELTGFVRQSIVRSPRTRTAFREQLAELARSIGEGDWRAARDAARQQVLFGPVALGLVRREDLDEEASDWLALETGNVAAISIAARD